MTSSDKVTAVPWAKTEMNTVRQMWDEGKTASQIGAVVGRTRNSVISLVRRAKLPFRVKKVKVRAAPKPKPRPAPRVVLPVVKKDSVVKEVLPPPEGVSLMELKRDTCRWPTGDGIYCGGVAQGRRSYCDAHHALGHQATRQRNPPTRPSFRNSYRRD